MSSYLNTQKHQKVERTNLVTYHRPISNEVLIFSLSLHNEFVPNAHLDLSLYPSDEEMIDHDVTADNVPTKKAC